MKNIMMNEIHPFQKNFCHMLIDLFGGCINKMKLINSSSRIYSKTILMVEILEAF